MKELRHIAIKAGMFIMLLILLNQIYLWTQYEKEVEADFPAWQDLKSAGEADILYLGESSNITYGDLDYDKGAIHEFLHEYFPEKKVQGVTQPAAHAGHYLTMLRNVPPSPRPKVVVVTLNLRSFSAPWVFSKQEPALAKKMVLLGRGPALWRRYLLSMRKYYRNTEKGQTELIHQSWKNDSIRMHASAGFHTISEWDSLLALRSKQTKDPGKKRDWVLATHYVKAYGFQIDTTSHPRIADLDAIAGLAKEKGWHLVFNLLPENVERSSSLLGDTLTNMMQANAKLLEHRYKARGVTVVNLLDSLPNAHFIDQDWTTEHYDETGRRKVAHALSLTMKDDFPGEWKDPKAEGAKIGSRFINDCEGGQRWAQMHTCSDEKAHSGRESSKFGGKDAFSITWTSGLDRLDSLRLDSVEVSFWLYQEATDHAASIAFEASGDSVEYMWDSLSVKRFVMKTHSWERASLTWPLWPKLPDADIMKIYFYNPSPKPVWVDDIVIQFK